MITYIAGKDKKANDIADEVITRMLEEYSGQLYGFTRSEFDTIFEYDILNVLSFYYSKMDARQKESIVYTVEDQFGLVDMEETVEDLSLCLDDNLYIPYSCKLMDRLGDSRVIRIVYSTIFYYCTCLAKDHWDQDNSFSNYLVLLNAAYFAALANKLHVKESFISSMQIHYGKDSFDEFTESLYEKHLDNPEWDIDIDLDYLDGLIEESKKNRSFKEGNETDFYNAAEAMNTIRREHAFIAEKNREKEGFEYIVQETGIREQKSIDIHGFECHFCEAKYSDEEYVIVYQKKAHIREIIDDEVAWSEFQRDLYREDIRQNNNRAVVYFVYILDSDSDNIPIQIIESNKTYGRKYVFTEEEAITFINGIVKTSSDEIGSVSPVQEWDRILREEHLTGCLTEPYAAKKVENYLMGERFDADYVQDDDYSSMKASAVPQVKWVKSLDTTGFRDFCFDDKVLQFGQINLFYGANGSGKTSVLEAIEYALTAEVRRVKDFKVKLPTGRHPEVSVYDREAGVHKFTPDFSKKNSKEIERVWYGVPIGRTRTNLNDNFNRFNAFDSEAAYKFIHESDNSEDSFASMFGNLMFGETIVDHEKKWQRFKRAFNDRYTELRSELSAARSMAEIYEQSLAMRTDSSKVEEIESGIVELKLLNRARLPKSPCDRYTRLLEELRAVRKYVDLLSSKHMESMSFAEIAAQVAEIKSNGLLYTKQKRDKAEQISKLAEDTSTQQQAIVTEREKKEEIRQNLDVVNTEIRNWAIVQKVLSHEDSVQLAIDLADELEEVEQDISYISKIEQYTAIVNFLKMESYDALPAEQRQRYEKELEEEKAQKLLFENQYNDAKKAFGEREQQSIELRKIGKILMVGSKCPLCGHEHQSTQQLVDIIDSAVVVDDNIEKLIIDIQKVSRRIIELEKILDRERLIDKALTELSIVSNSVPFVSECGTDYKRLYVFYSSKDQLEKRKAEIIEQQAALILQGFSISNITACKEYKNTNLTYYRFTKSDYDSYDEYLQDRLFKFQNELADSENAISDSQRRITKNEQTERVLRSEIHQLESKIDTLDVDGNRENEQALETLKTKFELSNTILFGEWFRKFHLLFDKCEMEVERLESQSMVEFERQTLAEYKETIKRDTPMVERCARAVQAFERMPSLSSFVEKGIRNNIKQISKFFKWMHHSGEFERLDIDEDGIYAVRDFNKQIVRTYEMSTGQRSTIAMAVMFALHMAAPDAPQFLLLDEPLATMDDTQVLNVLDILKSLAEQNTQIFFTTANGIMIDLFKKSFKDTSFDYKEYQFIKRVNRPSEIKESSINDTKTIEELTLDDLTLDFHQFAQIREILRRNQEKLVASDEWETLDQGDDIANTSSEEHEESNTTKTGHIKESFFALLTKEEQGLLLVILHDDRSSGIQYRHKLWAYPSYRAMIERINEKAMDYYGETIIENDDELPWIDDEYLEELNHQFAVFTSNGK